MTSRLVLLATVALLLAIGPSALAAEAVSPGDVGAAVKIARDAREQYDRGAWAEARRLFALAEGHAHSPVLLLYLARCDRNLGSWVAARATYARLIGEPLAKDAPEPFARAQSDAERDLQALLPRIPTATIGTRALPAEAAVELDGVVVPQELTGHRLDVDPGRHFARARVGAQQIASSTFVAEEGKTTAVELEVPAQAPTPRAERPRPSRFVPVLVGSMGAAALGAGVVTRIVAFHDIGDVESRCRGSHCLASDEPEATTAKTLQTVSSVCLVAAAVAGVTAITVLVVQSGSEGAPKVAVSAGLASAGVTLAF